MFRTKNSDHLWKSRKWIRRDTEIDKLCHNNCEQKALMPVIEVDENHCHKQIIRTNIPPYHLCHK